MTIQTPVEDDGSLRSLIVVTEEHLMRTAERLNAVINEIIGGAFGQVKDVAGLVAGLEKALQATIHERIRVEKLRDIHGRGGGEALDLGAARDEIGRRLARLRDTGDG